MRSRLRSNIKKKSLHILLIMAAIVLVLVFFGSQLLIGFSTILGMLRGDGDQPTETTEVSYIAPPILNPLPTATNKEKLSISGSNTLDDVSIKLYVNEKSIGETRPNANGDFTFYDIHLEKGNNEIKARTISQNNKTSGYSNILYIKYIGKEPTLEISEPQNEQKFKKDESPIKITGKSDPGVKVTVNDFWAISNDNGSFYYFYNLKDGDNNLAITATDEAGNKITKDLKIKVE